jgi:hypothetical protein
MTSRSVFIDTSYFYSLVDTTDTHNKQAQELWTTLRNSTYKSVTTNYILDESYTLIRARSGIHTAQNFARKVQSGQTHGHIQIERIKQIDEEEAWKWFTYDWKKLSYTDCTSFAIMKRLAIPGVLTFDSHFTMAGFEINQIG